MMVVMAAVGSFSGSRTPSPSLALFVCLPQRCLSKRLKVEVRGAGVGWGGVRGMTKWAETQAHRLALVL